jgi:predicted metal-dependent hydrolase
MARWRDKAEFKARVYYFAERLDVKVKSLAMRQMSTKWASCSTNGRLNFNSELLAFDRKIGDYVIVHELLHFNVPNHGKLWKSLMRAYVGDYEKLDQKLRQLSR